MLLSTRFILFALLLAAVALWVGFKQTDLSSKIDPLALQDSRYSWQFFNSTAWQVDKQQPEKNTITQAESIFYQEAEKKSELSQPFILIAEPEQTFSIESRQGRTFNESRIEFEGDVRVKQFDQPYARITTEHENKSLKTERLLYNTHTKMLTSDEPVVLYTPGSEIAGTGLKANLETERYQLLSNVKGTFIPQNQQAERP